MESLENINEPRLTDLVDEQTIALIITRFYGKVYVHPQLAPLFAGVDRTRQEQRLAAFIKMTKGVSNCFDGAFLKIAHERLPITNALFELRESLLEAAIRETGCGQDVIDCWRHYDELWRQYVVSDCDSSK